MTDERLKEISECYGHHAHVAELIAEVRVLNNILTGRDSVIEKQGRLIEELRKKGDRNVSAPTAKE